MDNEEIDFGSLRIFNSSKYWESLGYTIVEIINEKNEEGRVVFSRNGNEIYREIPLSDDWEYKLDSFMHGHFNNMIYEDF